MESPLASLPVYPKNTFEAKLAQLVADVIQKLWNVTDQEIIIEYPKQREHGDFACNIALQLSKELQKNPRKIAEEVQKAFPKNEDISKIEIAGPGFLNFFLSDKALLDETRNIFAKESEYILDYGNNLPVVVEYSAPNIAKPLAVHHLLSTVIGQSLANIYEAVGFDVISVNHIGDWGTQFGKLIYAYRTWGDKETIEKNPIDELLKIYVKFHEEAEKDPTLEDRGREEFLKIEQGDSENTEIWKWFCDISMQEIQKTYDRLGGIHFDHTLGESFYEDKMEPILEAGKKSGVMQEGEKGAWLVFFADEKYPPMMVQRSDGATLYATRDLAQVNYRSKEWGVVKNVLVVDVAQELHFNQYFETVRMMGLNKTSKGYDTELIHAKFGRMSFPDKAMSTRKGNVIMLEKVLDEAEKRALDLINEKESDLTDDEKKKLATMIGIGAVKYNVLSQNRTTNITFDWDKCLSFDKNSAPYIQYTYARSQSILRKAKEEKKNVSVEIPEDYALNESEKTIIVMLSKFPNVLITSYRDNFPHQICNYLYDVCQEFNRFYNSEPILFADNEKTIQFRLCMTKAVSIIIKHAMKILGVEVPDRM